MGRFLFGVVLAGVLLAVGLPGLPAVHAQLADDQLFAGNDSTMCNGTAMNGTIVLTPGLDVTRCKIIVPGNSSHVTTIVFSRLHLQGADNLTVYDGDTDTKVLNVTGSPESLAVVISSNISYLIVYITANKSGSILEANYSTSACRIQQTVKGASVLRSPVYLPGKASFSCSYILQQPADVSGTNVALTFTTLALSNATLTSQNVTITGASLPPDVYGTDKLQMVLTVPKSAVAQNFSGIVTPITSYSECGEVRAVGAAGDTLNITVPASQAGWGLDCRVTLWASKGKSLRLRVTSLRMAAHGDSLELVDGGAMAGGKLLASFTASSAATGYLVLSGQKQVLVRLVLGIMKADRSLTIEAKELDTVNHLYTEGNFTMGPATGAPVVTSYYVLEAAANSVVNFVLGGETPHANKTYNYTVSVYDDAQPSSSLLVTFSNAQRVPVVSSHGPVLLVVSMSNVSEPLTASFTSQAPGCDQVTSAADGSFRLTTSPSVPALCTWTVAAPPNSNGTILLDMATVKLPQKALVRVYSGVAGSGRSLVAQLSHANTLTSAPLPSVAVPASHWAQVVWSSGNSSDVKSMAVNVRYQLLDTLCGGEVQAAQGHLRSPSFPNLYPLNTACLWTFPPPATTAAKAKRVLLFDFPRFQLAPNHSVVISEVVNGTVRPVASLNGSDPQPDVVFASSVVSTLNFSAQLPQSAVAAAVANQVAQGFDIQYWTLSCGGFTKKGKDFFSSPGFPSLVPVSASNATLCVWMVRLPNKTGDDVNIVNLTLQIRKEGSPPVRDLVKVYDGDSLRHDLVPWNASKDDTYTISTLSRRNSVLVVFNATASTDAATKLALRVNYTTFSCNQHMLCGNGLCMHPDWKCNNKDDCGDDTDEQNCVGPPAPVSESGTKPAIVVLLFFVGLILGILLTVIIPRIIRRFRTNRYSTFRDEAPVA